MTDTTLSDVLSELAALARAASLPPDSRWLDVDGVAAMLSYERETVLRRIVTRPDFPQPLRIGHPRWRADEVKAWADAERRKVVGRPRKAA